MLQLPDDGVSVYLEFFYMGDLSVLPHLYIWSLGAPSTGSWPL